MNRSDMKEKATITLVDGSGARLDTVPLEMSSATVGGLRTVQALSRQAPSPEEKSDDRLSGTNPPESVSDEAKGRLRKSVPAAGNAASNTMRVFLSAGHGGYRLP
jgi:N-acetylmuramoyl-L-alanine amidase